MRTKIYLATAFACIISTSIFAQSSLWGVRASTHSTSLLSKDGYNTDGFGGKSFSVGFSWQRLNESSNVFRSVGTGLIYRQMELTGKTSSTVLNLSWIEIPCDFSVTGAIGGIVPIGLNGGVYAAIPTQYKGSIYRYQQPNYQYGNEKYEKPYVIFGARLGGSFSFRVSHFYTTLFANYNLSLIPIGKGEPDGVERAFSTPLPVFFEWGLYFHFGTKILKASS